MCRLPVSNIREGMIQRARLLQVPKEYIPGVTKGLEEMMSSGALAGFPVVDVVATLYDGSYHDVDSSVLAFQIAARQAFRCAPRYSCTLGPSMLFLVHRPE